MKTIFVSSTFKDMHYERDAIQEKVLPVINSEAQKYSQRVSFCDLRWGVNTTDLDSDEGSKKVLNVCLDEIDRCMPPMVVILGDRYGWIPDENLILTAAQRKKFQLEDYAQSVTALEIEYGALSSNEKRNRTLFYFREIENEAPDEYSPEDEEHTEKLNALKEKISALTDGKIRNYTVKWNGSGFDGMDTFAAMLAEDLKARLLPEWEIYANLTPFEREIHTHMSFIEEKSNMFRARQALCDRIFEKIISGEPVNIIKGVSGSGKSTLLSSIAVKLRNSGMNILPFVSGLTMQSNDAMDILKNIIFYFEEKLGYPHYDDEKDPVTGDKIRHSVDEWRDKLDELCGQFSYGGNKVVIVIDAIDQLTQSEERDNLVFMPRNINSNVQIVISCLSEMKLPGYDFEEIPPLDSNDRRDVIKGTLAATGRELDDAVINEMITIDSADNPLFLSLLIQRLTMMNRFDFEIINSGNKDDQMSEISKRQLDIIRTCPHELGAMCVELLAEAGRRINPELVNGAAEYIAVSRHGLRQEDLDSLLNDKWDSVDFANFVAYMSESFIKRDDGRYDFSHKSIRDGYRAVCKNEKLMHEQLVFHMYILNNNDELKKNELCYHIIKSDMRNLYIELIENNMYCDCYNLIANAAKVTYEQCIEDNGEWLCDLLCDDICMQTTFNFIDFINVNMSFHFVESMKELNILLPIINSTLALSEKLAEADPSDTNILLISCCYSRLADIYKSIGGLDNLEKALDFSEKAIECFEENHRINDTYESASGLSYTYEKSADIHKLIGGRANLLKALPLYEKAFELREPLFLVFIDADDIGEVYRLKQQIANIYTELGGNRNIEKARNIRFSLLDIFAEHSHNFTSAYAKRSLACIYESVATEYIQIGGADNFEKALFDLNIAKDIHSEVYNDIPVITALTDKCRIYELKADIKIRLGGFDNLQDAISLLTKEFDILQNIYELTQSDQIICNICNLKLKIVTTYKAIGTKDSIATAIAMTHETIELIEEKAVILKTGMARTILATSYETLGLLYTVSADSSLANKTYNMYKKALQIRLDLLDELETPEILRHVSLSYMQMGLHLYSEMNDYKNAVEYFSEAIEISTELYNSSNTAIYTLDLVRAYFQLATLYTNSDPEEYFEQIDNLYRKAITLSEKLYAETNIYEAAEMLTLSYSLLISAYLATSEDCNDEIFDLTNKSYDIHRKLLTEYNTEHLHSSFCSTALSLIQLYLTDSEHYDYEKAFEICNESIGVSKDAAEMFENESAYDAYATALESTSRFYVDDNGKHDLYAAAQLLETAVQVRKHIAQENQTETNLTDLADCYTRTASVYMALPDNEGYENALQFFSSAKKIYEHFEKNSHDAELLDNLAECCMSIAVIQISLGNTDTKSLSELFMNAIQIREKLAETEPSEELLSSLADTYQCIAETLAATEEKSYNDFTVELLNNAVDKLLTLINDFEYEPALQNYAYCNMLIAEINENTATGFSARKKLVTALKKRYEAMEAYEMILESKQTEQTLEQYFLCCYYLAANPHCPGSQFPEFKSKAIETAQSLYETYPCQEYMDFINEANGL